MTSNLGPGLLLDSAERVFNKCQGYIETIALSSRLISTLGSSQRLRARSVAERLDLQSGRTGQSLGSTGSLSSAKTPKTHS
jgi:hypothetical protein